MRLNNGTSRYDRMFHSTVRSFHSENPEIFIDRTFHRARRNMEILEMQEVEVTQRFTEIIEKFQSLGYAVSCEDQTRFMNMLSTIANSSTSCYTLCIKSGSIAPLALFLSNEENYQEYAGSLAQSGTFKKLKKLTLLMAVRSDAAYDCNACRAYEINVADDRLICKVLTYWPDKSNQSWVIINKTSRMVHGLDMDMVRMSGDGSGIAQVVVNETGLSENEKSLFLMRVEGAMLTSRTEDTQEI